MMFFRITIKGQYLSLLIVLAGILYSFAGSSSRTQFTVLGDGVSDSGVVNNNGIALAIKEFRDVKIFGDSIPDISLTAVASDIIQKRDTMIFFSADTVNNGVYYRKFTINQSILQPQGNSWVKFCDAMFPQEIFFNIDKGNNGYLASFIRRSFSTKKYLRAHNGTAFLDLDSTSSTGWLFSSQCAMDNDTFLIMYSNDMSAMKICKVYSSGTTIRKIGETTITTGSATPGNSLMTSVVSFDGSGTILACWNRGTPKGAKSLHYTFFNRSLNALIVNDSLSQIVGDTNFYYNNAAGVASYGIGQFAVFFWDVNALYLSRIRLNGGVVEQSTGIIANGNMRFCTASSSEKFVYVMCKGDIDGNGISGIEGIRYPLINGSFSTGQKFSNSDPLMNIDISDHYSTMLNCTVDTLGTVGAAWKHSNRSKGSVLAYRGVRYKNGYWTSPVDSLNVNNGDSIQYYPSEVLVSSESTWYVEDSIRMGCTAEACKNAQWYSFSDLPLLESLKTTCRYYQYRIKINRKTGNNFDSISTPVVSSVTVPWNVKPAIVSLDSIGVRSSVRRGVTFGTTFTVMSRIDTVYPFITLRDQDNGDLVRYSATWPASGELLLSYTSNGFERNVQPLTILPLPYDTVISTQINVRDFQGWSAQSRSINLVSRNSLPLIKIKIKKSGNNDTILMNNDWLLELQDEDTLFVNYSVIDTNDVAAVYGKIRMRSGVTYQTIDSTQTSGVYRLICRSIAPVDTAKYLVDVSDPDTSYGYRLSLVINHKPAIDSVSYMGKNAKNNDTIRINAGLPITFRVHTIDTDLDYWDTLQCSIFTKSYNQTIASVSAVNQFTFTPQAGDSIIRFKTVDKYGRSDSIILFVKMPWFETDTIKNPRFSRAMDTLEMGVSLIDRSMTGDTVVIPLLNTGNDTMHITGCMFRNTKNRWLTAILRTNVINISNTFTTTVALKPMIAENLVLEFSSYQLTGDSVEYDTVQLTTDDPAHHTILIPVRFEYNDLPVIVSIDPDYIVDRPYWALGKKLTINEKPFPPHAALQISFSEPMDSVSARNAVMVYSVYDSINQNRVSPIPVNHVWVQNYTKLRLVPAYTMSSSTYGFKPPSGLFIATDSLALHITSELQDKAATPSGPNALDIKKSYQRSEFTDTTFHMKVDSVDFTLIGITPVPGDSQIVSKKPEITLTFSAPIYARTVDTSKVDNKTLIVSSRYNGGRQFVFDSIYTSTNSATFRLARNLFYNDSVRCLYKSVSVRNMSGYSIDKNRNGIPAADYDTLSSEDDVLWMYKVKDIKLLNVSPINGSISNSISPPVVLTFSEPVWPGSFDTSLLSGNRSISLRSLYSSRSGRFTSIQYSVDSTRITLQPNEKYFSDDSISCMFSGFSKKYSYGTSDNLPRDTSGSFSYLSWYFLTSNTGFYTFPNPYKPGKDPRHCSANGPCGIWFKNLHSIRRGVNDIAIRIYDMNANVLFDTKKKNGLIHFETGNSQSTPQWLWDTRNMKGELVASGLYMYAVFDKDGKILVKDKLVIVR